MNTTTDEVIELTAGDSWVLLNSINILLMQAGFSLLEAGTVDKKHGKSVLMKNLMDGCFGAIVWYFCGYGIYTGDNSFGAGTGAVFLPNQAADFKDFFVSYAFAITGATIVSGAVVGRIQLKYYLLCSFLITGLVYPLIAHWVWNSSGFLNPYYVVSKTEILKTFEITDALGFCWRSLRARYGGTCGFGWGILFRSPHWEIWRPGTSCRRHSVQRRSSRDAS